MDSRFLTVLNIIMLHCYGNQLHSHWLYTFVSIVTVSYTHLDVYKRQMYKGLESIFFFNILREGGELS